MILKAKERGNAPQLARYLLAMRDNDHVELHEVRGFISDDLVEAFGEAEGSGARRAAAAARGCGALHAR